MYVRMYDWGNKFWLGAGVRIWGQVQGKVRQERGSCEDVLWFSEWVHG